jgi:hypothetical protein
LELRGKILALVLWGEDDDGEESVNVFTGTVRESEGGYVLDRGDGVVAIRPEWMSRVKAVPDDLKDILLGAEWELSLTVGNLPDDADPSEYEPIGLRIPSDL